MKIVILCLGNPILTDDGVGIHIAPELRKVISRPEVFIVEAALGGVRLLDLLAGCDHAIIVDAIVTKTNKPGYIHRFDNTNLQESRHSFSAHDISLGMALELGDQLNIELPKKITVFAVEAENVCDFGEECSKPVKLAIPKCVSLIVQEIDNLLNSSHY